MPTYQYTCTNPDCANRFEAVQAFTDPTIAECPVCGGAVRKVFSSVGVVFKGSGFYRNDSRNESPAKVSATKDTSGDSSASPAKEGAAKTESSSAASKESSSKESSSKGSSSKQTSSSGSSGKAAASA